MVKTRNQTRTLQDKLKYYGKSYCHLCKIGLTGNTISPNVHLQLCELCFHKAESNPELFEIQQCIQKHEYFLKCSWIYRFDKNRTCPICLEKNCDLAHNRPIEAWKNARNGYAQLL